MSDAFVYTTPLDPRARPLIEELTQEYERRYGEFYDLEPGPREMEKYPPQDFAAPDGNFLLLLRDGQAISGGAFKRYDAHTAEFKRVWTHSGLRRQGLALRVLKELEAQALRQGYSRIYLTTGFRQPEAVALYLGQGYKALFDTTQSAELPRKLAFEKLIAVRQHSTEPANA
ncbi:GNAT family N-acetyltransferase [uncultured Ramlibacter sp.]|uniref:GNAT family N-acetyltransferase n=1 Tax=uncultured Ramlibacter sp. TaxID=260755 RepID=UPI00261659FB|nr:GNAT family N-acetyltransferase [uncultured Ramlibacter sp.]